MLSTKAFGSAKNAREYYSHADYYGEKTYGQWYGLGAEVLGFKGRFQAQKSQEFTDLLKGILPNNVRLGRIEKHGEINHRPGIDLTFSSPKSFSIMMHIFANEQEKEKLAQARMQALHNTLSYVEKSGLVFTRRGKAGKQTEPVKKLIFALFEHDTNRNLEPQDHVHCLLANAALCEDGKYRSIVWDKIFENNFA